MIKKTITLLVKDIMLLEQYSLLAVLVLIGFPVFLNYTVGGVMGSVYLVFLCLDFCAYIVFGQIYLMESKYKGMTYLMACPFTRTQMIAARYVLLLLICGLGTGCYKALEWMNPVQLFSGNPNISFSQTVIAVSIVLIAYDVLIPILNNCAYEKVKVVHAVLSVFIPLWGMILVRALLQHFQISWTGRKVSDVGAVVLLALDVILTAASIEVNRRLWEKREF